MFQLIKSKLLKSFGIILVLAVFLSACNVPSQQVSDPDELVQKALQTLEARSTQQMLETLVAQLTQVSQETAFPQPTPTATQMILQSSPTPYPPTNTPMVPTPTVMPVPCNIAKFIKDVTIPDNTLMDANATFTKTWRLQNVGSCTWTTDYDLVFVSGTAMNALAVIPLSTSVAPGQVVDLSVNMKAPDTSGEFTGYWMLRNQYDARFGIGVNAAYSFSVKIKVKVYAMVYNFADKVCDATWGSSALSPLPCPGDESSIANGYVVKKVNYLREDGGLENELGLATRPNNAADGVIFGLYPAFSVKAGDQFRAIVNCEYGSTGCNVTFRLKYQTSDGQFLALDSWHEIYEGKYREVSVDLTPLAGKNVRLVLYVKNNNTAVDNKALWILPSIWR
ncbi:MAG: NBR1-Ig-like domain-containing protein [Anaerolineaceae bacterium]|nr:NBR1-Ig-like domain-containing protein [Anaerolineaceae bacterium]